MLVRVRACGVPLRLTTIGIMSTLVPCEFERSACARGEIFAEDIMQVVDILKDILCAVFPVAEFCFAKRGVAGT
jgi:hypothetical protein